MNANTGRTSELLSLPRSGSPESLPPQRRTKKIGKGIEVPRKIQKSRSFVRKQGNEIESNFCESRIRRSINRASNHRGLSLSSPLPHTPRPRTYDRGIYNSFLMNLPSITIRSFRRGSASAIGPASPAIEWARSCHPFSRKKGYSR